MRRLLIGFVALLLMAPSIAVAQTPTANNAHQQPTIAGTALDLIPKSPRRSALHLRGDDIAVVAYGETDRFGNIPVVVRNSTDQLVSGVVVKVEARDSNGKLLGVGESSEFIFGLAPYFLNPGDIAIGTVRLDGEIPASVEFHFSARAGGADSFWADLNADIEFGSVEWLQDRIVGEAVNPHDFAVTGVSLQVMCFSDDGTPLFGELEFMTGDDLGARETNSFQVGGRYSNYNQCEHFLIAGTGTPD